MKNKKETKNLLKDTRDALQSLMLSMIVHPDNIKGSEFDDMTSIAQDAIDEVDRYLNKIK